MSSASKFILYGIGATLFRAPRTRSANPPLLFAKPSPLKPLRFHRCISSSAAVDTVTAENTNYAETLSCVDQPHPHPWPEWVSFVDRLKTKGYLVESSASSSVEGGDGFDVSSGGVGVTTNDSVYRNMNLVKDACLSFARDRYDIFKSLSEDNIQAVVKSGCPNLLRKAVNSAKRLRAYVRLDEGDACSTCNLRGSCDRAYVILKVPEANARTVDIMRILMNYALDPLVISGGEKPPGRDVIESSTRKLLSELIELSESSTAPAPPPPPPKATTKYAPPGDQSLNLMTDKVSKNVDMRFGDWMCPKCNFMNFQRNQHCLKCNEEKPSGVSEIEIKKGDWICSKCSFINFSRNICCLKCNTEGPKRVNTNEVEKKKGDWDCPRCGFMNFASNKNCLRCPEPRPKRRTGEWHCPKCDFLNFERNKTCLKCNSKSHKERRHTEDDDYVWIRPN